MKKTFLSLLGILVFSTSLFAQRADFDPSNARDGETVEYCGQHTKSAQIQATQEYIDGIVIDNLEQEFTPKGIVYYIPVVFHVLHNGGNENISNEQIFDAVDILNRDFRLMNADANNVHADFQGLPEDAEIEFRLATKSPNGTCFNGITRTNNPITFNGDNGWSQVTAIINGNDVQNATWPGNNYLNIFVVADAGGAAGYTTLPGSTGMTNGIWILHSYVGSIGTGNPNASRALTHEVGHWLNLEHTWGGNNNPGNPGSCSTDDGVADTPNTIGVTSCALNENTCGPRANVENYMDYSYCSKMFTPGQVTRMRNALNSGTGGRSTVRSAANLTNVGADGNLVLCEAEFSADRTSVCPGDQIQFTDESFNAVSGWTWTFPGGVPANSSAQNPVVTYSTPGIYSVTLAATDGSGNDSETKTAYIRVVPAPASIPMLEGFETYTTFTGIDEWEVYNPNGNGFELTTTTGLNSAKSARLMNHGQTSGSIDQLISSPVDLSSVTGNMTLSYRYAYKRRTTGDDDVLRTLVSNDCGESWAIRNTRLLHIVTPSVQSTSYVPASDAEWTTVHITTINSDYYVDNFRYKFEFESGGGNNIYLDNINIYQGSSSDELVVGLSDIDATIFSGLNLFPNPADDELNIQFSVETPQDVVFNVQDLTGKVALSNLIKANSGSNHVFMNTSQLAAGVYFLEVQVGGMKETRQFIIR